MTLKCGECTLCCKLLNIPWMDSPAGELCKHCDEGKGCKIYDTASKKCLDFHCAYIQMEKASINLRPDKCNVIFERIYDIFIGTIDPKSIKLNNDILGQIHSFIREGFSVVLFNERINKPFIYPSNGHTTKEIWEKVQMEASKINGSSNIHN